MGSKSVIPLRGDKNTGDLHDKTTHLSDKPYFGTCGYCKKRKRPITVSWVMD